LKIINYKKFVLKITKFVKTTQREMDAVCGVSSKLTGFSTAHRVV